MRFIITNLKEDTDLEEFKDLIEARIRAYGWEHSIAITVMYSRRVLVESYPQFNDDFIMAFLTTLFEGSGLEFRCLDIPGFDFYIA